MNDIFSDYESLIERFVNGRIGVEDFQSEYLNFFKREERMIDEPLFELLDELFGDVDSFTNDPQLIAENPDFYLDEKRLRLKAQAAATRLRELKAGVASSRG